MSHHWLKLAFDEGQNVFLFLFIYFFACCSHCLVIVATFEAVPELKKKNVN